MKNEYEETNMKKRQIWRKKIIWSVSWLPTIEEDLRVAKQLISGNWNVKAIWIGNACALWIWNANHAEAHPKFQKTQKLKAHPKWHFHMYRRKPVILRCISSDKRVLAGVLITYIWKQTNEHMQTLTYKRFTNACCTSTVTFDQNLTMVARDKQRLTPPMHPGTRAENGQACMGPSPSYPHHDRDFPEEWSTLETQWPGTW
jgi:hypothetical protein